MRPEAAKRSHHRRSSLQMIEQENLVHCLVSPSSSQSLAAVAHDGAQTFLDPSDDGCIFGGGVSEKMRVEPLCCNDDDDDDAAGDWK